MRIKFIADDVEEAAEYCIEKTGFMTNLICFLAFF